jgi:hypothetical protein
VLPVGFEPTTCRLSGATGYKSAALPLSYRSGVWCPKRDSNSHTFRYQNLNLARLPIPPSGLNLGRSSISTPDFWSGWQDSNLRFSAPKADGLTRLSYTQKSINIGMNFIPIFTMHILMMGRTKRNALPGCAILRIILNYGADGEIRTPDPLITNQ